MAPDIFSHFFQCLNEDDEDHLIITEFTKEELLNVVDFCLKGQCDNTNIPDSYVLKAFGLSNNQYSLGDTDDNTSEAEDNINTSSGNPGNSGNSGTTSGPPVKVEIKEESYEETEFKAEPLSDEHDDDDLNDFLWTPDQDSDSGPPNGSAAAKHAKVKHHPLIPKKKPFELRTTNQALSEEELAKFEDFEPPGMFL